jgi:Zn-dependent peptidase ImmA (M78 family)
VSIKSAEAILKELGITEPQEIDLEAIAWHLGAKVKYRPLDGCEARILGNGDQAIITVNSQSIPRRQRFSIAHELGHWCHHRGQRLMCHGTESGAPGIAGTMQEKTADHYAADLLLPHYIFQPLARKYPKLSFKMISELAEQFNVSKTAIAIRLIEGR